ncbi:MAG TPA: carboxylating nicotinate-nucleotide diphosphorylase [Steroidobacteraceae bacterium]|nr:carboxylating nicotinate-nucleotide diphosphorylase [Steroidobacteraceae bacterium]
MESQVGAALREDIGTGDVTSQLVPSDQRVRGTVVTREDAVLCGRPWVEATFRQLDPRIRLSWRASDSERIARDQILFEIEGPARPVLTGERTALNFLQLLSGTATAARRFADAIAGTGCSILDTRKTVPGLRTAQKYAVRCGGGRNHRIGLYDLVLIKENHIIAAGSLPAAVAAGRAASGGLQVQVEVEVEVEVETLQEFSAALESGADIIMLDEFSLTDMQAAVRINRSRPHPVKIEASGSVSLENVREIALTGVDYISVGSITKHVRAVDLSMRLEFPGEIR